jgi:hypothetical protein
MSAREVYQDAIVEQFNSLPFQIPPIKPVVQPYKTFLTQTIALQPNTAFQNVSVIIPTADFINYQTAVSLELQDGINFASALPFGLSTWVNDSATEIIASLWNSTNAIINCRIAVVHFY